MLFLQRYQGLDFWVKPSVEKRNPLNTTWGFAYGLHNFPDFQEQGPSWARRIWADITLLLLPVSLQRLHSSIEFQVSSFPLESLILYFPFGSTTLYTSSYAWFHHQLLCCSLLPIEVVKITRENPLENRCADVLCMMRQHKARKDPRILRNSVRLLRNQI